MDSSGAAGGVAASAPAAATGYDSFLDPIDADSENKEKKRVLIIYTGGTMGMKPNAEGSLAPEPGYLVEVLTGMPEMQRPEMPSYTIKEYDPLIDSSSMGPKEWIMIASDIESNYLNYDGFVVCMGTDTMAYAASALSFMLENLGKPVIFTGSLIPQFEVYTDARRNILVSIIFAVSCDIPEVCICFNDNLLRANRTMKINNVGMAAFDSPNYPHLGILGTLIRYRHHLTLSAPRLSLKVHKKLIGEVLVVKLVPGFNDEALFLLLRTKTPGLRAIVLELYGTGNGPTNKQSMLDAISKAQEHGLLVVALSQCLKGGVALETYALGREFLKRGVVPGGDMTTAACVTKIAYLFGRRSNVEYVRKFLQQDLRGEITPESSLPKKFFSEAPVRAHSRL